MPETQNYTVILHGTKRPLRLPLEINARNTHKLRKMELKGTEAPLVVEFKGRLYSFSDLLEFYAAPYMLSEICQPLTMKSL